MVTLCKEQKSTKPNRYTFCRILKSHHTVKKYNILFTMFMENTEFTVLL